MSPPWTPGSTLRLVQVSGGGGGSDRHYCVELCVATSRIDAEAPSEGKLARKHIAKATVPYTTDLRGRRSATVRSPYNGSVGWAAGPVPVVGAWSSCRDSRPLRETSTVGRFRPAG